MNKIIFICIFGFFSNLSLAEIQDDFPIHLDASKSTARKMFGKPNRSGKYFDSFFNSGIVLVYSPDKKIISLEGTEFVNGSRYKGTLASVALGDPLSKCVELWGQFTEDTDPAYKYFVFDKYRIKISVYEADGKDENSEFHYANTVRSIEIKKLDNPLFGLWYDKRNNVYMNIVNEDFVTKCQFSKVYEVISITGNIKNQRELEWGRWNSKKWPKKYTDPKINYVYNDLFQINEELLVGGQEGYEVYTKTKKIMPDICAL